MCQQGGLHFLLTGNSHFLPRGLVICALASFLPNLRLWGQIYHNLYVFYTFAFSAWFVAHIEISAASGGASEGIHAAYHRHQHPPAVGCFADEFIFAVGSVVFTCPCQRDSKHNLSEH